TSPEPQSSLTAPTEAPTSTLTPDAPKVPATPASPPEEGLRSMLEGSPSFDTQAVPDPANAQPLPKPVIPEEPARAAVEAPSETTPPSSDTPGTSPAEPAPESAPKGELDNPLFNWAQ
ncbi:MAG: hypothetical protein P1V34_10325, partial [Alphaproteobacteria bacterium]|nr:hypothetical protein [Alphaproteobacteria bacterium]